MSERLATWATLGTNVQGAPNVQTVIATSGLDYEVEKRPLFMPADNFSDNGTIELPNRFVTVRKSDNHPYDVVSDKFEIIQNRDAFDFVNYMGDGLQFEKAGETASGMVYIIGRLPDVNILGDVFTPHVIFRNGFNGKVKITAAICPLRVVCQNQFNVAFRDTENTITIRYVQNAERKLEEAREVLKVSAEYMVRLNSFAEQYAKIKLSESDVKKILDIMFPIPLDGENVNSFKRHRLLQTRDAFVKAYTMEDNTNFKGTAWGLVNAYTDFLTHKEPQGNNPFKEENKFITTTFGQSSVNTIIEVIGRIAA